MQPVVYMLCKHRHGALYTGVTSDLARRVWEHRTGAVEGFTKRYGLKAPVWYEPHDTMEGAIVREKQIKAWKRDWKIRLIERMNPTWRDLYEDLNRWGAMLLDANPLLVTSGGWMSDLEHAAKALITSTASLAVAHRLACRCCFCVLVEHELICSGHEDNQPGMS